MTKKERNIAATAVYLILRKNDKILLGRRCNTGYLDEHYQVPAGHIDAGEVPTEAMVREAHEELGITIAADDLVFAHAVFRVKSDKTGDRVDYYFEATKWEGEPTIMEPEKCDDLDWFSLDALPEKMDPCNREVMHRIARGEIYSEFDIAFLKTHGMYHEA